MDEKNVSPDTIIKFICDQYMHHDRLYWAQIGTVGLIQAAVFTGAYSGRGTPVAYGVVFVGIVYLAILYLYLIRVQECRDGNMAAADGIMSRYASDELLSKMGVQRGGQIIIFRGRSVRYISGGNLLNVVFIVSITLDIMCANYFGTVSAPACH